MLCQNCYYTETDGLVITTDPLINSPESTSGRSPVMQTPHLEDSYTVDKYSSESPQIQSDYNISQSPHEQWCLTTNMLIPYSSPPKKYEPCYDPLSYTIFTTPMMETIPTLPFNGDQSSLVIKSKITPGNDKQNTQDFIAKPDDDDQDIENREIVCKYNVTAAGQSAENKVHLFPPLSSPGHPQISEAAVNKALGYGSSPLSDLANDDDMTSQLSYDEDEEEEADQIKQESLFEEDYEEYNIDEEQIQENNGDNKEEEEHKVKEESPNRKRRASNSSSSSDNEDYNPEPRKKKRMQHKKTTVTKKKKAGVTKQKKAAAVAIERPFKCPHCDHAANRLYNLNTHKKTHNKDRVKEFPCDECGKGFDRRHDRDRHMATVHQGKRSHVCHLCTAQFSRGDALNRHLVHRHSHNEDDFH